MKTATLAGIVITAALATSGIVAAAAEPDTTPKVAHKSHHIKHAKTRAANPYADLEPYRSFGFIGPYPGDYARTRASGTCAIDLGYGRWMSCDQGGGGNFR